MKSFWKWVLGIVIVVAVIAAAMFGIHALASKGYISVHSGYAWQDKADRGFDNQSGPEKFSDPHGFNGWNAPRGFDGGRGPLGRGRDFGPLGMGFMFIGGLFRLAFFGALLYGAYWLGKRNARVVMDPAPVASAAEPVEAPKPRTRKVTKS